MTALDSDVTLVTEELLEEEVACDIVLDVDCPRPAAWRAMATHANGTTCGWDFCCDHHRRIITTVEQANPGKMWSCTEHDSPVTFTWQHL